MNSNVVDGYKVSSIQPENSNKALWRFCINDERINRNGWKTITSGIDFSNFMNNPVVLLQHNNWSFPIGKAENIFVEGNKLYADIWIHEETEEAMTASKLIEIGVLNATSLGILPTERGEPMPIPAELKDSLPYSSAIEVFTKSELLEISIVTIPANAGTTLQKKVASAFLSGAINTEIINKLIDEDTMPDTKSDEVKESLYKDIANLNSKVAGLEDNLKTAKSDLDKANAKISELNTTLAAKDAEIAKFVEKQSELEVETFVAKNVKKIMPVEMSDESTSLKAQLIALKKSGLTLPSGISAYEARCQEIEKRPEVAGLDKDIESPDFELSKSGFNDLSDVAEFNKSNFGRN